MDISKNVILDQASKPLEGKIAIHKMNIGMLSFYDLWPNNNLEKLDFWQGVKINSGCNKL